VAKKKSLRAPLSALEKLHASLADQLEKRIKRPDATAADMQAAVAFLKNNGIEVKTSDDLEQLEGAVTDNLLPFKAGDEPVTRKKTG
jgi:hypothetical protein